MTREPDFAALFDASPYPCLLIDPDLILIGANPAYLQATDAAAAAILGKNIFEAFPSNPGDPDSTNLNEVRRSIEIAFSTGKPHTSALLRYAVPDQSYEGTGFKERFWSAIHTPVFDKHGKVMYVAQNAIDVTDLYRFDPYSKRYFLRQSVNAVPDIGEHISPRIHEAMTRVLNAERSQLQNLFDQAPGFIAVLAGQDHEFEMANDAFYRLVGHRDLIGKTLWDALPELAGQGFEHELTEVFRSARAVVSHNRKLDVRRELNDLPSTRYIDVVFQPVVDSVNHVTGVLVQGHDVTGAFLASTALEKKVKELERIKARQSMLLKLGDQIRSLSDDPGAMTATANRELAAFLNVPRVGYVTFEENSARAVMVNNTYSDSARMPPLPSSVEQPDDYGRAVMEQLRAGHIIVVDDLECDPRTAGAAARAHAAIGAKASLAVPIRRNGRSVAFMFAHHDKPRQWSEDDIEVMRETADRTWEAVERSRAYRDQKASAIALKRSEERYRSLFESIDEGFCIIEVLFDNSGNPYDFRFCEVNPSFEHQTGLRGAAGRTMREFAPNHEQHWFDIYGRVAMTGEATRFENEAKALNRWFDVFASRIEDVDGPRVAVVFKDITERKQLTDTLRQSEKMAHDAARQAEAERSRLDALLQAVPVGIVVSDSNGAIVLSNATHKELWGEHHPNTENVDQFREWKGWWADHSDRHGRRLEAREWTTARILDGEESPRDLIAIESFDVPAVRRTVLITGSAIRDGKGKIVGAVVAQMDISDRIKAEDALRKADLRKDEFLAMLAHELRNPLAPISAAADLLRLGRLDEIRVRQTSSIITRQVKHMTGLVDDLLDVSRVTRGLVKLDNKKVDVKRVLADAVEQVRPLIEMRRHNLAVHTPPEPAFVSGDIKRLVQIFTVNGD